MFPTRPCITLALVGLATCAAMAQAPQANSTAGVPQPVLDVFPSVVRIYVVMDMPGGGRIMRRQGSGSGVIVSKDGYVVTNHHVAGNASHIVCSLSDHQELPARLVGTDALADIAVLKMDLNKLRDPSKGVPAAQWGNSDKVAVGDPVFAMGSPGSISQSVTKGIIANNRMIMPKMAGEMSLDGEDNGAVVRWLAHDAVIFGGNSGGPLINADGKIIGINEIGFANLSGAIPGNLARSVSGQLTKHGEMRRSWSGLTLQANLNDAAKGALIADVVPGSPAATAGIAAGDTLLSIGEVETNCRVAEQVPVITAKVMDLPVGATVTARFVHDGEECTASLHLELRDPARRRLREERRLGVTYGAVTRMMQVQFGLEDRTGIMIHGVRPNGAAASAFPPLDANDVILAVNGKPIADSAQFAKSLAAATNDQILLSVRRGKQDLLLPVKLSEAIKRQPAARPKRAWLPILTQVVTKELAEALSVKPGGVRITQVLASATEGGDLLVGDIVTAVDGKAVSARRATDKSVFRRLIERRKVGERVELTVLRAGAEVKIPVSLLEPPASVANLDTYEDVDLEFSCRDRSSADDEATVGASTRGVIVTEVAKGGWASLGGIAKGDRILLYGGAAIGSVDDLSRATAAARTQRTERIIVQIARGHRTRFLRIEPVWE